MNVQSTTGWAWKATWCLWVVSLAVIVFVWVVLFVAGDDEPLGNAAFGLLVSAVLVNGPLLLSLFLSAKQRIISRLVWGAVAVGCLVLVEVALSNYQSAGLGGADIIVSYTMNALSFPIGWVVTALLYALGHSGLEPPLQGQLPRELGLFVYWALYLVAGYFQWFKLLPYAIRRFRAMIKSP